MMPRKTFLSTAANRHLFSVTINWRVLDSDRLSRKPSLAVKKKHCENKVHISESKSFSAKHNITTGFCQLNTEKKRHVCKFSRKSLSAFLKGLQRLQKQHEGNGLGELDQHQQFSLKCTVTSWLLWAAYCPLPLCFSKNANFIHNPGLWHCKLCNSARWHAEEEETRAFCNKRWDDSNHWQICIPIELLRNLFVGSWEMTSNKSTIYFVFPNSPNLLKAETHIRAMHVSYMKCVFCFPPWYKQRAWM